MNGLLNLERLDDLMSDRGNAIQQMPLDYEKLLQSGALRVTQPGTVMGSPAGDSDPESYSIVSAYNDAAPDSVTRGWADKPESYASALQALNENSAGPLYDGKYRQMLWSAQQKGLNNYFMPYRGLLGR